LVLREGIRPPKFAGKFAVLDFDSPIMPVISLYPVPEAIKLADLVIDLCGMDCKPRQLRWADLCSVPRVTMTVPLVCQIFNWSETIEWGGLRFVDVVNQLGLDIPEDSYVAFHSRDGVYFEALPAKLALDPRVMLATSLGGEPLSEDHGGPMRLVVPFLQGYKSVKWLEGMRVTQHDPVGTKRLLGQSKTAYLGLAWRSIYGIEQEPGAEKTPV
jgi:DMSO/TMAO reductase YedYZ molybdopterin-dependent catalytic subunit